MRASDVSHYTIPDDLLLKCGEGLGYMKLQQCESRAACGIGEGQARGRVETTTSDGARLVFSIDWILAESRLYVRIQPL